MNPKMKKALFAGTSLVAAAQITYTAVQSAFPPAFAQQSFPTHSVTGNEIVQDESNPTSGFFTVNQLQTYGRIFAGHLSVTGTPATVTNCGATPAISGTDVAGRVTFGTGSVTSCTILFASAYVNPPYAEVRFETGSPSTNSFLVSTTNIAITMGATAGTIVDYFVFGQPGG